MIVRSSSPVAVPSRGLGGRSATSQPPDEWHTERSAGLKGKTAGTTRALMGTSLPATFEYLSHPRGSGTLGKYAREASISEI